MIKAFTIILAVIILFPVVTGFSIRERGSRIGLVLVVLGFTIIIVARHLYPQLLYPTFGETAEKNTIIRGHLLNLWNIGLWVSTFGAVVVFISSTIRMWALRKELFPFLFNRKD